MPTTEVQIIAKDWSVTLLGASLIHDPATSYGREIIRLLDQVWPVVRNQGLKHPPAANHAVYDAGDRLFAGVQISDLGPDSFGLEIRTVRLARYARCMHIGPYGLLGKTYALMHDDIARRGLVRAFPVVEIYGDWNSDEAKLETEILIPIV